MIEPYTLGKKIVQTIEANSPALSNKEIELLALAFASHYSNNDEAWKWKFVKGYSKSSIEMTKNLKPDQKKEPVKTQEQVQQEYAQKMRAAQDARARRDDHDRDR